MRNKPKIALQLVKQTFGSWIEDRVPRLGAALAFYTIFAIAPLFVIVLAIAGLLFGEEAARRELYAQLNSLLGETGGEAIQSILAAANQPRTGTAAALAALATLVVGATGVFVQLQDALNTIWDVRREPGRGWVHFIKDRLLSFAMILGIGFLLLVSLILSAALAAFGKFVGGFLPQEELILQTLNFVVSLGVVGLLFAMIFKILPDVKIAWHDVWIGAALTSVLFNVGKLLLGLYLGRSSVASAYGAAGSLVIVLLWVYYSSQILFFGAEFTQVYANHCGSRFKPARGAHFVTTKEVPADRPKAGKAASPPAAS